jgi:branched-chain amino acid transport system substrate-binding protein
MALRRMTALMGALLLLTGLAACGGDEPEVAEPAQEEPADEETEAAQESAAEPSGEPIRIGGSLGLTGSFAGPSEHYRTIYEAAVEEINADGGLLGRPVELVLYDDESTQATAQALYQRLINEDNVDLLLAPYTTFIGGSVIPVVRPTGRLMVNAGFTGWQLARQYDRIFFTWTMQEPTWTQAFFDMVDNLPEDQRPERMALLVAQNPFPILSRDGVEGELGVLNFAADAGIEVVLNEEYPADATDLSGLIQRAQDADADMLVVLGLPNDSVLAARTVAELGYEPEIYCTCGSSMTTFPVWQDLGDAGNHVFTPVPAWSNEDYPGMETVIEVFEEAGVEEMPAYGPVAYAALQVIQQAVEATGGTDNDELTEYIRDNTFETATGMLDFDEFGIPTFGGGVVQYVDGRNNMVWPADRAEAEPIVPRP